MKLDGRHGPVLADSDEVAVVEQRGDTCVLHTKGGSIIEIAGKAKDVIFALWPEIAPAPAKTSEEPATD